jgi:DNA-binding LacI/PurR family transcriptional regulator
MTENRRPTIKTVAARAGVGRTTVSRVVNGSDLVSADVRSRVLAAIKAAWLPAAPTQWPW